MNLILDGFRICCLKKLSYESLKNSVISFWNFWSKQKKMYLLFKNMAFIRKKMGDVCLPMKTAMGFGQKFIVDQIPGLFEIQSKRA